MADLKTLAQLVRLPNVFTAASNVLGAYLLTHSDLADVPAWGALVAASCCLYLGGMVLNDVYDAAVDAVERPSRPIPSGRISVGAARGLGWALLAAGVLFAAAAAAHLQTAAPLVVGLLLAGCIWLYDGVLKSTPLAPLVMGLCRFLNVLLGFSPVASDPFSFHPMFWIVAAGVGTYVVGLTLFAKSEAADEPPRRQLLAGLIVMLAGIALLAWFPSWRDAELPYDAFPGRAAQMGATWWLLWGLFGVVTLRRAVMALAVPESVYIQATVKQAIFSLVIFDAAICAAARGPIPYTFVVLALLVPMNALGRWIYST